MFHPLDREFYLTLPSNASATHYPKNTLSSFTVKLHTPLELEGQVGDWEVGLCECIYPTTIGNVARSNDSWWRYRLRAANTNAVGEWIQCQIPTGMYDSADELVKALNKSMVKHTAENSVPMPITFSLHPDELVKKLNKSVVEHTANNSAPITFNLHPSMKNRISVKNNSPPTTVDLHFSSRLSLLLGFTPEETTFSVLGQFSVLYAPQPVNLTGGISLMYIYSDLCQQQLVGDAMVPLLRVVPLSCFPAREGAGAAGAGKAISCKEYPQPHYVPIRQRHITTVTVDINTDTGEPMPFMVSEQNGGNRVVVKLHIRPTKRRH